jgi:3-oxoacyl-[acyl-carrier-protein] synthase III
MITLQQCASSLTALDYARNLFHDPRVSHVVVVAFDFVVDDDERIRPFALFSDAVTSCMVTRSDAPRISLLSYGVGVDFAGFVGRDDFMSRKRVAVTTLESVLGRHGLVLGDVAACFSTNFYKPVALFNANICGIGRNQLCIDTLASRGHCGNCDWMINLMHRRAEGQLAPGKYLAQAFAPGFFACALLDVSA